MNHGFLYKGVILLSLTALFLNVTAAGIDLHFATQRHNPNLRLSGLAGAGVALIEPASGCMLNPAVVSVWHRTVKKDYSFSLQYEYDSLFNKYIATAAASFYGNEKNCIAALYRSMKKSGSNYEHDFVLCLGGNLFEKNSDMGAVNMATNFRYETLSWTRMSADTIEVRRYSFNAGGGLITDSFIQNSYFSPFTEKPSLQEKRLLLDLGFYQNDIAENVDLALVFYDIWGYCWKKTRPTLVQQRDTLFQILDPMKLLKKPLVLRDSSYYRYETEIRNRSVESIYKRMTLGVTFRSADEGSNPIAYAIPFDCEFFGLFDKEQPMKIGIHTGMELWFSRKTVGARFGYAYAPHTIPLRFQTRSFHNVHWIAFGATVAIQGFTIDGFWQKNLWGIACSAAFGEKNHSTQPQQPGAEE
ncbi:MAG: hypothetical protein JW795_01335 [Chitinivibrionales bacterium]|nr:hypothetical protein [Chitinivibrionales bacterium]